MGGLDKLKKELLSIPGWGTKRKIVVFESDDWGSIRMPSQNVFSFLKQNGVDVITGDSLRYNQFDTLASADDLDALYHLLRKYKDSNGKHPVITAVTLVANPDFDKIRNTNFNEYYFEPFTETLKRYYPNKNVFQHWTQGIKEHLFVPEFHGREHLHVGSWMKALRNNDSATVHAFNNGMWGYNNPHPVSFQAAFDIESLKEIESQKEILKSGLTLFERLFGYKASFFVPPNGIMHEDLYQFTADHGIEFMYSSKLNPMPLGNGRVKKQLNYLGKKNKAGQLFITRNAFFEPSQGDPKCVTKCLNDIEMAFRWNKPAIISSHRVNYIGALDEANRNSGLEKLQQLLSTILSRWPEVEFMTTPELGRIMKK